VSVASGVPRHAEYFGSCVNARVSFHNVRLGWHPMQSHLTRALLTLGVVLLTTPASAEIRITSDAGGNLAAYQAKVEAVRRSGENVVIDGPCNSACTLWLTLPTSQVCVTPRARFVFHAAINSDTGLPNPRETDALWHSYPARVQIAIGKRGGLSWIPVSVPGREVARGCKRAAP
jgi:hypothetical protein